jgi:hypothetical protein
MKIAVLGGIGIVVVAVLLGLLLVGVISAVGPAFVTGNVPIGAAIFGAFLYIGILLLIGGLSLVWITQPIIEHVVESITVMNAGHLDTIRQRSADAGADAEGFADALDIGGAL